MKTIVVLFICLLIVQSGLAQTNQPQLESYESDPIVYAYPKKNMVTINPVAFGQCLALNTKKYKQSTIQPTIAKDGTAYSKKSFDDYLISSRYKDFSTGQEKNLQTWILRQRDNSIDPLSLFNISMQLNKQNAWASMITIYELLRFHARWWTQPQKLAFTNKVYHLEDDGMKYGSGGGGGGGGGCFLGDAKIRIFSNEQNHTIPIKDIAIGTVIDSYDPETNRIFQTKVGKLFQRESEFTFLTFTLENGKNVTMTSTHPIFLKKDDSYTYIAASEVPNGSIVKFIENGKPKDVKISSITSTVKKEKVFNIHVVKTNGDELPYELENFIADDIIVHNKGNVGVKTSQQIFNKFIDIRGDLKERGEGFEGDHKGSWYRIWGMMLYRLSQNKNFPDFHHINSEHTIGFVENLQNQLTNISSIIVAYGVELEKLWFHDTENDARKAEINKNSTVASTTFLLSLYSPGDLSKPALTYQDCENRAYLSEQQ